MADEIIKPGVKPSKPVLGNVTAPVKKGGLSKWIIILILIGAAVYIYFNRERVMELVNNGFNRLGP